MSVEARLLTKVDKTDTCWNWNAGSMWYGYGRLKIGGKGGRMIQAHRIAYRLWVGPIPDGLHIDHLCRNRACVNPDHLEAVTPRENLLRGYAPAAINARLTVCKKGLHPLEGDNLNGDTPGHRRCKACRREYEAARNARQRAARAAYRQERAA